MAKKKDKPIVDDNGKILDEQKFLTEALKRFKSTLDNTSAMRTAALDDNKFKSGKQWDDDVFRQRELDKRPALTVNRILPVINQVVNDGLQNLPAIKFRPIDNMTDVATADVISGMTRHILNNSDSQDAMGWAFDNAVSSSMGYFRICTDYYDEDNFEQEIRLQRIDNASSVYIPIHLCKSPDFSDAPYAFIREKLTKDEFEERWPDVNLSDWESHGTGDSNWTTEDEVYIAEYFYVKETYENIYLLQDGTKVKELLEGQIPVKTRKVQVRKVFHYLLSQFEVLEQEKMFPSRYIPIIAVCGQELNVDGEKQFFSLTRMAKDPQRMHNYWLTAFTEQIALQPKAPYMIADGQIAGYEAIWKDMNTKPIAYLPYHSTNNAGQPVPPPSRVAPPVIGDAILRGVELSSESIKETTGVYDAALGAQGNETSGRAIIARQTQTDRSNFHFMNNFNRSLRFLGKLIIDMIPNVYDTPRIIRCLGEDMSDEIVQVNQYYADPDDPAKSKMYDLTVGKYDVVVDIGPSYATKRTEAAQNLISVINAIPTVGQVCSDILVRNLDFPGASELSDRLKKTIPPNLMADKKGTAPMTESEIRQIIADLQIMQQQLEQSQVEKQQMGQMILQMQQQLKDKTDANQMKMDAVVIKANADLEKAQLQYASETQGRVVDTAVHLHQMAQPKPSVNS